MEEELKKILPDYSIKYVRPPYGRYTQEVVKAINRPLVLWTIDSGDWQNLNVEQIYTTVINNIQDRDIIVFHDDNAETVKAIEKLLLNLNQEDFNSLQFHSFLKTDYTKNVSIFFY